MRCVRPVPSLGAGRSAVGPALAMSAEQRESFRQAREGRSRPQYGRVPGTGRDPLRPSRFPSLIPDEIAGYVSKS